MIRVIVTIEDGMLTGVFTKPEEKVEVKLLDYDNISAAEDDAPCVQFAEEVEQAIEDGDLVNCY